MKCFFVLVALCISFISAQVLSAQSPCPPDTGFNCTIWKTATLSKTTVNPQCQITVQYRWRECNGEYQIYYDNVQRSGNCTNMGELWDNQDYVSSFNEWLDIVVIEELVKLPNQPVVADCPGSFNKAIFYTASCGLWVKCTYTIDPAKRVCDQDWRGTFPEHQESDGLKLDYYKWQSCGQACCKKTYSICKSIGTSGQYEVHINQVTKQRIGSCSNPDGFVSPCQDGC